MWQSQHITLYHGHIPRFCGNFTVDSARNTSHIVTIRTVWNRMSHDMRGTVWETLACAAPVRATDHTRLRRPHRRQAPPPHHTATEPYCTETETETHPNRITPNRTAIQPPSHGFRPNSGNRGSAIAPRRRSGTISPAEDGGIPRETTDHRASVPKARDLIRTPITHYPAPNTQQPGVQPRRPPIPP